MALLAGEYDRRISILFEQRAADDTGQIIRTWVTLEPGLWARRIWRSGAETFAADTRKASAAITWEVRWYPSSADAGLPGLTPEMRVNFKGEIHEILAVEEVGRKEKLRLHCIALQNVGNVIPNRLLLTEAGDTITTEGGDIIVA